MRDGGRQARETNTEDNPSAGREEIVKLYFLYMCIKGFQKTGLWLNVNKTVMSLWVHSDLTTKNVLSDITNHLNECLMESV